MQKKFLFLLCLTIFVGQSALSAARSNYLYRNRLNWVKLEELSKKQLAGVTLQHPVTEISDVQMQAMLQSIQMNKGSALKSDIKTTEVFDADEAQKFAPLIVQALQKAAVNQVVHVSLVHDRSGAILRNAYLTMLNVFKTDAGVHFYFGKLFAKLDGDYMEVSDQDKTIRDAKSTRVTLAASEGQTLAFSDGDEVILDANYDFVNAQTKAPATELKVTKKSLAKAPSQTTETPPAASISERLKKLDELKEEGLLSDKEYKAKKKEILDEL